MEKKKSPEIRMSHCGMNLSWNGIFESGAIEKAHHENGLLELEFDLDFRNSRQPDPTHPDSEPGMKADRLTLEELKDVIGQGLELGARRIILNTKGSQLNESWVLDMIRSIHGLNGEFLFLAGGRSVSQNLAVILFESGIHVAVELDGPFHGLRPDSTGEGDPMSEVFPGLRNLLNAGYPSAKNRLGIEVVISRQNIASIPELWRWSRLNGMVPLVRRAPLVDHTGGNDDFSVSIKEHQDLFERLSKIDRDGFDILWKPHLLLTGLECDRILYSLTVHASGSVKTCMDMDFSIGNVRKAPLKKIIESSEELEQLREIFAHIKGYCRKCRLTGCSFGCRAAAHNFTGDYLESDPWCWKRRQIDDDHKKADAGDGLPHKDGMKLIDGTALIDKKKIQLKMAVSQKSYFVSQRGQLAPLALVEMVAQLCAVQQAFELKESGGQILRGYLVGMDNVQFMNPAFAGEKLEITAWKTFEMDEIHKVQGEIFRGVSCIGRAELTLYKTNEWHPFSGVNQPENTERLVLPSRDYPWIKQKDQVSREILKSVHRFCRNQEDSVEGALMFRPDFICFSGHFPDYPVLPAIVFLQAAHLLAEIGLRKELDLVSVKKGKLIRPVHPYDLLEYEMRRTKKVSRTEILYSVLVKCRKEAAAKFDLGLIPAGGGE